jgi:hypothetical protein
MFHRSEDPMKVVIDELTKQGVALNSEALEKVQPVLTS